MSQLPPPTLQATVAVTALLIWAYMTVWFVVALVRRRNDLADVAWGLGFVFIAFAWIVARLVLGWGIPARLALVGAIVAGWGLRLAWHIWQRHRSGPEDPRYAAWRRAWGRWFVLRSYLQVFVLQGLFMLVISLPILVVASGRPDSNMAPWSLWTALLGGAVAISGIVVEAVSDRQLSGFLAGRAHRGHPLDEGLWRYSRHPNYFGEILVWWGVWLVSVGLPGWTVALLGPLTITLLLRYVSGVPLLERRHVGDPEWEAYRQRTSVLVPLPPKRSSSSDPPAD